MDLEFKVVQEQEDSVDSLLSICFLFGWMVWVGRINHRHCLRYLMPVSLGQVFEVEDDLVDYYQEVVDRCLLLDSYSLGR